jgi:hypothetical protein
MALFLITPISDPKKVMESVKENFPSDYFQINGTNSLLVHSSGTTKELSDRLKITEGENGTGIVVSFLNYYGRGQTDMWEWIQSRLSKDS